MNEFSSPLPMPAVPVSCNRWLEIELYWFDRSNKQTSVDTFWFKYAPLMRNATGRTFEYADLTSGETSIKTIRCLDIKLRQAESRLYGFRAPAEPQPS